MIIFRWTKRDVIWARGNVKEAEEALEVARIDFEDALIKHFEAHPLSDLDKRAILGLVEDGYQICCEAGRQNLIDLKLDPVWVKYLNSWAYDSLGCNPRDKPGGDLHTMGLERLRSFLADPLNRDTIAYHAREGSL